MDNKKKRQSMMLYAIIAVVVVVVLRSVVYPNVVGQSVKEVDYSTFISMVDDDKVSKVQLNTDNDSILFVSGEGDSAQTYRCNAFPNDTTLVQRLEDHDVQFAAEIPDESSNMLLYALSLIHI